jgi:hypothetical protein
VGFPDVRAFWPVFTASDTCEYRGEIKDAFSRKLNRVLNKDDEGSHALVPDSSVRFLHKLRQKAHYNALPITKYDHAEEVIIFYPRIGPSLTGTEQRWRRF